jgi:hypothetical protein
MMRLPSGISAICSPQPAPIRFSGGTMQLIKRHLCGVAGVLAELVFNRSAL